MVMLESHPLFLLVILSMLNDEGKIKLWSSDVARFDLRLIISIQNLYFLVDVAQPNLLNIRSMSSLKRITQFFLLRS